MACGKSSFSDGLRMLVNNSGPAGCGAASSFSPYRRSVPCTSGGHCRIDFHLRSASAFLYQLAI